MKRGFAGQAVSRRSPDVAAREPVELGKQFGFAGSPSVGGAAASIFISYAHEDRERADQLAARLGAAGYSVWWDRKIRGGHAFDQVIEAALAAAKLVIVLWSQTSIHSNWVRAEATSAVDDNKLLPIKIDEVRPPLRFIQIQTTDLTGWDGGTDTPELIGFLADVAAHLGDPDRLSPPPFGEGHAAAGSPAGPAATSISGRRHSALKLALVLSVSVTALGLAAIAYITTPVTPPPELVATPNALVPVAPVSRQVGQPVVFDKGKVTFSATAQSIIEQQIVFLKENPSVTVTVEGYSLEGEGLHDTLQALAELRALQVRHTLIQGGIDGSRLSVVSHGGNTTTGGETENTQDPRVVLNLR